MLYRLRTSPIAAPAKPFVCGRCGRLKNWYVRENRRRLGLSMHRVCCCGTCFKLIQCSNDQEIVYVTEDSSLSNPGDIGEEVEMSDGVKYIVDSFGDCVETPTAITFDSYVDCCPPGTITDVNLILNVDSTYCTGCHPLGGSSYLKIKGTDPPFVTLSPIDGTYSLSSTGPGAGFSNVFTAPDDGWVLMDFASNEADCSEIDEFDANVPTVLMEVIMDSSCNVTSISVKGSEAGSGRTFYPFLNTAITGKKAGQTIQDDDQGATCGEPFTTNGHKSHHGTARVTV